MSVHPFARRFRRASATEGRVGVMMNSEFQEETNTRTWCGTPQGKLVDAVLPSPAPRAILTVLKVFLFSCTCETDRA